MHLPAQSGICSANSVTTSRHIFGLGSHLKGQLIPAETTPIKTQLRLNLPNLRTRKRILKAIKRRILKNHINVGAIDYSQWASAFDGAESALLNTTDKEIFEACVQELLNALHTSHVMFYDELPKRFPAQYTIGATLQPVKKSGDRLLWGFLVSCVRSPVT